MTNTINEMKRELPVETTERIKGFYLTVGSLYDQVLNVDNFLENDREKHFQFTKNLTNPSRTYEKCLTLYEEYKGMFENPDKAKVTVNKLGEYQDILSLDYEDAYQEMYVNAWSGFLKTSKIPVRQYLRH